jgi:hypothetical protein
MTGFSLFKSLSEIHENGYNIMTHLGEEAMLVFA